MELANNGRYALVTAGNRLEVWDVDKNAMLWRLEGVREAHASHDSMFAYCLGSAKTLDVHRLDSGKNVKSIELSEFAGRPAYAPNDPEYQFFVEEIRTFCLSKGSNSFCASFLGGFDRHALLFDTDGEQALFPDAGARDVRLSDDGKKAFIGWLPEISVAYRPVAGPFGIARERLVKDALGFDNSGNNNFVYVRFQDSENSDSGGLVICEFDLQQRRVTNSITISGKTTLVKRDYIESIPVSLSSDGRYFALSRLAGRVDICDLAEGTVHHVATSLTSISALNLARLPGHGELRLAMATHKGQSLIMDLD